ncbi:MAG: 3-carboxymuconate cyclase, partial [Capsulimonas sp.]|nr:3-carboxymuconate cyclase [Capsulimonas sp.]
MYFSRLKSSLIPALSVMTATLLLAPCRQSSANGTVTILHTFHEGPPEYDGLRPTIPLTPGPDGSFYGTTSVGGTSGREAIFGGGGVLFKISPGGSYTLLNNTFGDRFVTPQLGWGPNSVTIPSDGHLYVTTGAGLIQMTPQGVCTHIWSFHDDPVLGEEFTSGLLQAHDGCLYGTTEFDKLQTGGTVYKLNPQGVVSIIHRFGDGTVANDGLTPEAGLVEGLDGNLYGVTSKGGAFGQGVVFRMTTAGAVTILHSFGDAAQSNFWVAPSATLVLGSDRCFYGSTGAALFKITSTGVYTEFPQVPFYTHGSTAPALLAADGNIYVSTSRMLYRVTPSGVVTAVCTINYGSQGLVQGRDGAFYFTSIYGFDNLYSGAVYRLKLANRIVEGISPASVQTGHKDFFLNVTGSGFLPGDTVTCGGYPFPTSFGSESLLRVTIPYWLVASPQTLKVSVMHGNETPTPAPSLVVTAAPTLTRLSPASVQAGHNSFTLSVGGTGFVDGARVYWGGAVLPTTYVSPSLLTATVSAALAAPVNPLVPITVKNPNVTASNAQNFTVTDAPQITAFSPSSVQAGHRDFSLTITGTGFVRDATV